MIKPEIEIIVWIILMVYVHKGDTTCLHEMSGGIDIKQRQKTQISRLYMNVLLVQVTRYSVNIDTK